MCCRRSYAALIVRSLFGYAVEVFGAFMAVAMAGGAFEQTSEPTHQAHSS